MAAFTTIAAATVAIGGNVAKGIIAGDAASSAARQAGRLNLEKDKFKWPTKLNLESLNLSEQQLHWLFYALTFMSGARRQIFVVFAGFLMVEKFGLLGLM